MIVVVAIVGALLFGYLSRAIGANKGDLIPTWMNPLKDWLYAIPYGVVGYSMGAIGATLGYAGAFLAKRTGHGQYLDLGTWFGIIKAEKLDFVIRWFYGEDKNVTQKGQGDYWRDFTGLVVTGLATSLLSGIVVCLSTSWTLGFLIILGGAMKGPAYAIGWKYHGYVHKEHFSEPTEIGEFLTGFFAGLPLFYTIGILFGN